MMHLWRYPWARKSIRPLWRRSVQIPWSGMNSVNCKLQCCQASHNDQQTSIYFQSNSSSRQRGRYPPQCSPSKLPRCWWVPGPGQSPFGRFWCLRETQVQSFTIEVQARKEQKSVPWRDRGKGEMLIKCIFLNYFFVKVKVGFTVKATANLGGSAVDLSKKNKGSISSLNKVKFPEL